MKQSDFLPPHFFDEYKAKKEEALKDSKKWKIGPQWPSKYGPGGRRMAKAKLRKKK